MATYKTPDVYVEEISIFPPSVAEVETAIPAFIGYTEKADKTGTNDLNLKPTRISSMLDYVTHFGGGIAPKITEIGLDENNNFRKADITNLYFLYDSVRMFYANGGGDCYIVSVNTYPTDLAIKPDYTLLKSGLDAVEKYDEPTILLFPDAVSLSGDNLYTLQVDALGQCGKLMDRVALLDTKDTQTVGTAVADFRNKIGINHLKYGMAYTPWLNVSLTKSVYYKSITGKVKKSGSVVSLKTFTDNSDIKTVFDDYDKLIVDDAQITTDKTLLFGAGNTFTMKFDSLVNAYEATKNATNAGAIIKLLFDLANEIDDWEGSFTNSELKTTVGNTIVSPLSAYCQTLIGYDAEAVAELTGYVSKFTAASYTSTKWTTTWGAPVASTVITGATDQEELDSFVAAVKNSLLQFKEAFAMITSAVSTQTATYESTLTSTYPLYKNIIDGIQNSSTNMPPSGAVAGAVAATDRERGVWKAPANVSLASVIGPNDTFTNSELDSLNIDVVAGKSINAIRSFTGRGTLIWGARTLAGNDNEWRYVPVRRFFNMVEESIKKSTYWAVFEPNNANTWVKVKGMIENYLTLKWKDGALVGAKPDEAFFVKVSLGTTMTALDVLEGRMNVEIGMAVVRPAEFIILKFSHKLQQS
jgi:uncharacterized protein